MDSFVEFKKKAAQGNVVPLVAEMPADLMTPVGAFLRVARRARYSFLLESVEGGEKLGRYSFIGLDPYRLFACTQQGIEIREQRKRLALSTDPFAYLRESFNGCQPAFDPRLPRFSGGAVGYFGYDAVRLFERVPDKNPDPLKLPEIFFGFYDLVLAFDHLRQKVFVICNLFTDRKGEPLPRQYREGVRRVEAVLSLLSGPLPARRSATRPPRRAQVTSNLSQEQFEAKVQAAKDFIAAGDIFQVVLSQRFQRGCAALPFAVYRALRMVNPSPYMFFLKMDDVTLVGSSPEMLVRVDDGSVETRPIAGTRPRGQSEADDRRLAAELLVDPKERAEHVMLVDLGRNDIGRVSQPGKVRVEDLMHIERYSHVMHIVTSVKGTLRPEVDRLAALAACFPAGTVTGAPKIRAMQIIDEFENVRRGVYAGAVGYLDFQGDLDSCIAIRTIVIRNRTAYVQAGAGIVADSIPEREYQETLDKAQALFSAIELAERGMV